MGSESVVLFDDCRTEGALEAYEAIKKLRTKDATSYANSWPPMNALGPLIAESHSLVKSKNNTFKRDDWLYSNVVPLLTRLDRLIDDPMFRSVVDIEGSNNESKSIYKNGLDWTKESSKWVEKLFGGERYDEHQGNVDSFRIHIVNLRDIPHDISPFILGSLLDLYAIELFKRGQDKNVPTLLVLEEAHHYLRKNLSLENTDIPPPYERLSKEGRKFGLALWLSTQRPSELSTTVLSQCDNWFCFRLVAERDLRTVQLACESVEKNQIERISGLPRQNLMGFGSSVKVPILFKATDAIPRPKSEDAEFETWVYNENTQ